MHRNTGMRPGFRQYGQGRHRLRPGREWPGGKHTQRRVEKQPALSQYAIRRRGAQCPPRRAVIVP